MFCTQCVGNLSFLPELRECQACGRSNLHRHFLYIFAEFEAAGELRIFAGSNFKQPYWKGLDGENFDQWDWVCWRNRDVRDLLWEESPRSNATCSFFTQRCSLSSVGAAWQLRLWILEWKLRGGFFCIWATPLSTHCVLHLFVLEIQLYLQTATFTVGFSTSAKRPQQCAFELVLHLCIHLLYSLQHDFIPHSQMI